VYTQVCAGILASQRFVDPCTIFRQLSINIAQRTTSSVDPAPKHREERLSAGYELWRPKSVDEAANPWLSLVHRDSTNTTCRDCFHRSINWVRTIVIIFCSQATFASILWYLGHLPRQRHNKVHGRAEHGRRSCPEIRYSLGANDVLRGRFRGPPPRKHMNFVASLRSMLPSVCYLPLLLPLILISISPVEILAMIRLSLESEP
jgi:hypothetical protein